MQNIESIIHENLIVRSSEFLKDRSIKQHNFEKPMYPTCIFYLGENSAEYYTEMNNDLIRGWGEAAKHVRHYKVLQADNFFNSVYSMDGTPKDAERIQEDITQIMSASNVFGDMNYIHFYFIVNTNKINSTEFRNWYLCLRQIDEIISISKRTFFMTILNQSISNISESEGIRQTLLELYESSEFSECGTHIYDSVFLFSNRLKNGQFIKLGADTQEYTDYNLYADIVLLTNTRSSELNNRLLRLCSKQVPALTAAYSNLSKPVDDIVMITLKRCLIEIRRQIDNHEELVQYNNTLVADLLDIKGNRLPIAEKIYNNYFCDYIENFTPLNYMPNVGSVKDKSFTAANKETKGCMSLFVQQNYNEYIEKIFKNNYENIKRELKQSIIDCMDFKKQKALRNFSGAVEDEVQNEIGRLIIHADPDNSLVPNYIGMTCKNKIKEMLIPIAKEIILDLRHNSRGSLNDFARLYESIELLNSSGSDALNQNMNDFYSGIVGEYYRDQTRLDAITKELLSNCADQTEMVDALSEELQRIFTSNSVYSASFVDELIARIESLGTGVNVGVLIAKWLVNSLDNRIALYSYNTFSERFFEAYFLNTEQKVVFDAMEEMSKNHHIPVSYYNNLSNDMVESVWFYKCTEDNIRV